MTKKVFIQQTSQQYSLLFLEKGFELTHSALDADLVCFTGGEDVSPSLYNDAKHPKTFSSPSRDAIEKEIYLALKEAGTPMVGICRGGQFLHVMNGGRMYQHVSHHTQDHKMIIVETGESIDVSSTHHQMMMGNDRATILGIAKQNGSKEYMEAGYPCTKMRSDRDLEVLFYPDTKSLCFQPHPEFYSEKYSAMRNFFFKCVFKYCLGAK